MNDRIVIDPEIQQGKPVIRGTRVPIARIVGGLAGGMTMEEVIREYEISKEDVLAALYYVGKFFCTRAITSQASWQAGYR
ncbi:DUF433 domain-containing protein [candidate division KSB1 bacterium]|nr:DUF433 domain-containing protein [candidate division KSB1 bacterium]